MEVKETAKSSRPEIHYSFYYTRKFNMCLLYEKYQLEETTDFLRKKLYVFNFMQENRKLTVKHTK